MLIRFNKEDGTHGYEEIDFREIAPAASYETVSGHCPPACNANAMLTLGVDVFRARRKSD